MNVVWEMNSKIRSLTLRESMSEPSGLEHNTIITFTLRRSRPANYNIPRPDLDHLKARSPQSGKKVVYKKIGSRFEAYLVHRRKTSGGSS